MKNGFSDIPSGVTKYFIFCNSITKYCDIPSGVTKCFMFCDTVFCNTVTKSEIFCDAWRNNVMANGKNNLRRLMEYCNGLMEKYLQTPEGILQWPIGERFCDSWRNIVMAYWRNILRRLMEYCNGQFEKYFETPDGIL